MPSKALNSSSMQLGWSDSEPEIGAVGHEEIRRIFSRFFDALKCLFSGIGAFKRYVSDFQDH